MLEMMRKILFRATGTWKGKETQKQSSAPMIWYEIYLESKSVKPLERLQLSSIFKKYVVSGNSAVFCSHAGAFRSREEAEEKAKELRSKYITTRVIERSLPG
jgi:hypothetical protein